MELRRKQLRPIGLGNLCKMNHALNERMKLTEDYQENGNTCDLQRNSLKKLHIADVDLFYCANDNVFNNPDLLEVIPVRFKADHYYQQKSFHMAAKKRMKFTMKRKDFFVIQNPAQDIEHMDHLKTAIQTAANKFKLNLSVWNKYLNIK